MDSVNSPLPRSRRHYGESEDGEGLIARPDGTPMPCDRYGYEFGQIVRYILATSATALRWQCIACSRIQRPG